MEPQQQAIADAVRAGSGVKASDGGPDDEHIVAGVNGFVGAFEFWYFRFLEEKAIPQYRQNIIARINPFIRRIDCDGLSAQETAARIVEIYADRNFVTAGGWALEELAARAGKDVQKSPAEGVDLQRFDTSTNAFNLYVIKSGPITRNSDILNALKRNARDAEGRLRQSQGTASVTANYATATGTLATTFRDGVRRPSSAAFWSEILDLPEEKAIELAISMVAQAAITMKQSQASAHLEALKLLVADYIADRGNDSTVDWEFVATRNMRERSVWRKEDLERHKRAKQRLKASGYGTSVIAALDADDGVTSEDEASVPLED